MKTMSVKILLTIVVCTLCLVCCTPSKISLGDVRIVNTYLKNHDVKQGTAKQFEGLDEYFMKSNVSGEVRSVWKMMVDYIKYDEGMDSEPLDYEIKFTDGGLEFIGTIWESFSYGDMTKGVE